MYFDDLSPYNYKLPFSFRDIRNVGWLDLDHDFLADKTDTNAIQKLEAIVLTRNHVFDVHVNVIRGIHACNLCGEDIAISLSDGRPFFLGMSEIWIPNQHTWYAGPSMILHYMTDHGYLPPSQFIEAIHQINITTPYMAQAIYDNLIAAKNI